MFITKSFFNGVKNVRKKIVFKNDEIMILKRTFYGLIATTGIKKIK